MIFAPADFVSLDAQNSLMSPKRHRAKV
jgi:hypothetical protein